MSLVVLASVKGAPGVTTLACLVGATWPGPGEAVVAECDPSGGDLAARFGLSSRRGWPTVAASVRRGEWTGELGDHLQPLPGGLDVLVGTGRADLPGSGVDVSHLSQDCTAGGGRWDVLADLGRLLPGDGGADGWLERADAVAVVLGPDAASAVHVRDRAQRLLARCGSRIGLVVVGTGGYARMEIERFTGVPVIGEVPLDPAAAIAAGGPGGRRRLARSPLTSAAARLAARLAERATGSAQPGPPPDPSRSSAPADGGRHRGPAVAEPCMTEGLR